MSVAVYVGVGALVEVGASVGAVRGAAVAAVEEVGVSDGMAVADGVEVGAGILVQATAAVVNADETTSPHANRSRERSVRGEPRISQPSLTQKYCSAGWALRKEPLALAAPRDRATCKFPPSSCSPAPYNTMPVVTVRQLTAHLPLTEGHRLPNIP